MLAIINPATETVITELEIDTAKSIAEKFTKAKAAQPKWQKTPLKTRIKCIKKWLQLLEQNSSLLATTLSQEMGKPISQAKGEIKFVTSRANFFVEHIAEILHPKEFAKKKGDVKEEISYEPLGVIANISAWNYPYFVGANVFVPALLAGNAVLYKSSEFSPLSGQHITQLLHEAGVPKDVFNLIIGTGNEGALLLKENVDGVFFTGSYATGLKILESARQKIIPVQLELGGKDPAYVCSDVDIKPTIQSLVEGAFFNTGQSCCSIERIYVHHKIYDKFVTSFTKAVKNLKIGNPLNAETFIGPLTRKAQLDVLQKQIQDAVAKGAKILTGGNKLKQKGYYFAPTVLCNVNHNMLVMKDESFGPIVGIQKVQNDEEALKLMNDTSYGLTAAVFTKSKKKAQKLLAQINTGTVYWNCCERVSANLPWSGQKNSGLGVTLSLAGISAFTKPKAWHLNKLA